MDACQWLTKSAKDASGLHFCVFMTHSRFTVTWIGNLPPPIKSQAVALNWRPRSIKHTLEMKLIILGWPQPQVGHYKTWTLDWGRGTGLASPVLAGPLFWHPGPMTREYREGSFVYQSEIAALGTWCTKASLSANSHVLSTSSETVTETTKQWQWSTKVLRESIQTIEKWRWKKFSVLCVVLIGAMHSNALPSAVAVPLRAAPGCRDGLSYSTPHKSEETRGNAIT